MSALKSKAVVSMKQRSKATKEAVAQLMHHWTASGSRDSSESHAQGTAVGGAQEGSCGQGVAWQSEARIGACFGQEGDCPGQAYRTCSQEQASTTQQCNGQTGSKAWQPSRQGRSEAQEAPQQHSCTQGTCHRQALTHLTQQQHSLRAPEPAAQPGQPSFAHVACHTAPSGQVAAQ